MNMRYVLGLGFSAAVGLAGLASADTLSVAGTTSFSSDQEAPKNINIAPFDTLGGTRVLNSVSIAITHSGSVDTAGDNDDNFNAATVRARMIRQVQADGPDVVAAFGSSTVLGAIKNLTANDGDSGNTAVFDASAPDGTSDALSYANANFFGSAFAGTPALFLAPGPVNYLITPIQMTNEYVFLGTAPDAWQLEVQNPVLTVRVKVTYDYTVIPEPATLSLLALGALGLIRRR